MKKKSRIKEDLEDSENLNTSKSADLNDIDFMTVSETDNKYEGLV